MELNIYEQKEQQLQTELEAVAENAGNLFTANPNINCLVEGINIKIINCVDTTALPGSIRNNLGIPLEYGYSISSTDARFSGILPLESAAIANQDFIEIVRTVIPFSGAITKTEYNTTFKNEATGEVVIRVWKA